MKRASLLALMLLLLLPSQSASAQRRDTAPAGAGKMILTGVLYDLNGSVIVSGANVAAESSDGKRYESATDEEGFYRFELPFGVYRIRASAPAFCPKQVTDFIVVDSTHGKMSLDFVLEVGAGQPDCPGEQRIEIKPKRKRKKPGIVIE